MKTHKHHLVPRHMGGSDDPSNIVEVTVEEHAEAHRILFEQYGRWEDRLAWKGLEGIIPKAEIISLLASERAKRTFTGVSKSEEHKNKLSLSNKGKHDHLGSSNPMFNKRHSEKTKNIQRCRKQGSNNPCFNKVWITNGIRNQYIDKNESIPAGYRLGRTMKKSLNNGRFI